MNMTLLDDVLHDPLDYVYRILEGNFMDVPDGDRVFKNIQPRAHDDEFARFVLELVGPHHGIAHNFVRMSPKGQPEPNFIHTDEMMGDLTAILYLSYYHPKADGTTIYDEDGDKACVFHAKFNRMILFDSTLPHSRNIFENFGEGDNARIIQVIFLKEVK